MHSILPKLSRGKTKSLMEKPRGVKYIEIEREQSQQKLLSALEQVSKVLTVEVSLHKILEDIATIVAKALGAKWVNFWELTPDKKSVHIAAMYGMKPEYVEQSREHPIRLGTAWIGRAVKTKKAWGTSDILTDPHLMSDLGPTWKKAVKVQNYRALLCVPTISKRGSVGGICAYYPDPHEFTDFEMRILTVAANQAATSITNAQIFEELAAERNKMTAMINSLSDGIILYDLKDRITAFNPMAQQLLWVQGKLILGKHPSELSLRTNHLFKNIKDISSLALGEFTSRDITLENPQRITLNITYVPVRDAQYKKLGSMRVLHDITKEKEAEELKSSFITVASHQLRTPLSGIKWALSLLQEKQYGSLNAQQREIIKKVYATNNQLITLVKDLLDASRIEERRFGYVFKNIHPLDILNEVIKEMEPAIQSKKEISLIVENPNKELPVLRIDRQKFKMALYNIIDNAIKYTPKGKIMISFFAGESSLIIEIKDEGIGIPKNQQKFLFTKFFRAKNAVLLQTEGSGLGLWIANEIIKRHNGKIIVESQENKGSAFSIQLPIIDK